MSTTSIVPEPPPTTTTTTTTTAAVPAVAQIPASTTTTTAATKAKVVTPTGLVASPSCPSFLDYVRREATRVVGPYGVSVARWVSPTPPQVLGTTIEAGGGVAASVELPRTDASPTNVQEPGVDEPDLVKSDGRRLVALARGGLQVVDLTGGAPRLAGRLAVSDWGNQLFLAGDRVLIFSRGFYVAGASSVGGPEILQPGTTITVVDIANPSAPAEAARLKLEGSYISARMVNGVARIVVRSEAKGPRFDHPTSEADQARSTEVNRLAIQKSQVADWLPRYTLERPGQAAVTAPLASCANVLHPQEFAGLSTVTVLTLDPRDSKFGTTACVLGGGSIVYASSRNLYVATSRFGDPVDNNLARRTTTQLHQFSIEGDRPARFVGTGEVPGYVLNQFSLSEHEGHLRVASTMEPPAVQSPNAIPQPAGGPESLVTVLALRGPILTPVGEVRGLGRGERIFSVRFVGDRAYVVTFRQVDPLYVLDLRDPARPVMRGELKIPGYSSYLHPISDSLLVGIGQDATDEGRTRGTQISLFDVSDPAAPVRRHAVTLPGSYSEAESDHHAFLWWQDTQQLVVPLWEPAPEGSIESGFSGIVGMRLDQGNGFSDQARLQHPGDRTSIRRSLVVGDALLTVSDAGLLTSDLSSFAQRGWLAFGE